MQTEASGIWLFFIITIGPFILWGIGAGIFIILRDWLCVFSYGVLPSTRRKNKELENEYWLDWWPGS